MSKLHPVERWAQAYARGEHFASAHYNVDTSPGKAFFHSNLIAWSDTLPSGEELHWFSMRGWPTMTTRDRLNSLFGALKLPARIYQRDKRQRLAVKLAGSWFDAHQNAIEIDPSGYFQVPVGRLSLLLHRAEQAERAAA